MLIQCTQHLALGPVCLALCLQRCMLAVVCPAPYAWQCVCGFCVPSCVLRYDLTHVIYPGCVFCMCAQHFADGVCVCLGLCIHCCVPSGLCAWCCVLRVSDWRCVSRFCVPSLIYSMVLPDVACLALCSQSLDLAFELRVCAQHWMPSLCVPRIWVLLCTRCVHLA